MTSKKFEKEKSRIKILSDDISTCPADAIVIPATPRLQYHGVGIQKKIEERG